LGDGVRLAIIDQLVISDRSPAELMSLCVVPSNLLAHHLDVLEGVGLISRHRSSGDGRRRYVQLERVSLDELSAMPANRPGRALFVCTHNSARSQLAAALWTTLTECTATSAGTHPADQIHPGTVAAARRARLVLAAPVPRHIDSVRRFPAFVVTVCDRAHEELGAERGWVHWSIPDPVAIGRAAAFDATVRGLTERIDALISSRNAA
jgi:ArsR family transcriptional regulator, arsenate/arsenite/antimonite-responsive transcriptional repressor / arsenate reductase (thioredoxin)